MNFVIMEIFLGMLAVGVIGWAVIEIKELGKKYNGDKK